MAFGISRKPLDSNVQPTDADLAAMNASQGNPFGGGAGAVDLSQSGPPSGGGDIGQTGSGMGAREGVVGQAPPQMPTMMPTQTPRVEFGGPTQVSPPPPDTGGPIGAPGPSNATPSQSSEPSPVAGQSPNPEVAAGPSSAPPVMPPSFTPMQAPLAGQQVAQAAFPIERQDPSQDPSYGGWSGASDATASYPITRRSIGPVTGGSDTQSRLLGGAGGLLGGGLGVPAMSGGGPQQQSDIGSLIASLYRLANQNTQG
jgi:hypothetical protein